MAGHKYGEVNYKIGFDIDTQSLNNLKKELQAIQNMTTTQYQKSNPNAASDATAAMHELVAIKKEAETVEAALKKAFNVNLGTINLTKFNQELKGLNLGNLYRDFSKLGVQGQQAFRGITTELLTTNTQMRQTHQLLDSMATSFKNTVKWGISSSVWNTMTSSIQQA